MCSPWVARRRQAGCTCQPVAIHRSPDKVRELVNLWFAEAGANQAFPLDDRSAFEIFMTPRPLLTPGAQPVHLLPRSGNVLESQAVNVRNRSYAIGALVDIPTPGAQGVLFAHGARFGGHALYIKDNRLHYVYDFVGSLEQKVVGAKTPRPART